MNNVVNGVQVLNICNVLDVIAKAKGITEWWTLD